jgi:hypothetical protein
MILGGPVPGKHRKQSPIHTEVAKRGGTGLAAAALSITGLSTAVVTGTTAAVAPNVQLMALVSAANSTSQFFAGSSYYGTDWTTQYGEQQVVPFFRGPQGIAEVINGVQVGDKQTGVTASGWGAGQTGTALGILDQNQNQQALNSIGLVILDNNTNRAGGGFWTTYAPFAPLLFTSADPTPTDLVLGGPLLDVAYEYNINSDAAVDPLNPFALGNSLAAYAFGYGAENRGLEITQATDGGPAFYQPPNGGPAVELKPGTHYVVDEDGDLLVVNPTTGTASSTNPTGTLRDANNNPVTTIFVTVDSGNLPLTRPLRLIPGGDIIANAIDPVMTDLVNAGYNDGKGLSTDPAIPVNPAITRPMKPFSSLGALDSVPDSAQEGATAGAQTAIGNFANPANFITKPLGEAAKLPFLSTLTNSSVSQNSLNANKTASAPQTAATGSSGSERPRPLKKAADDFNSSLKKFADSLHKKAPAASDSDNNDNDD